MQLDRLTVGLLPRDHASSVLKERHWLPMHYRFQFKFALLMFKAYVSQSHPRLLLDS